MLGTTHARAHMAKFNSQIQCVKAKTKIRSLQSKEVALMKMLFMQFVVHVSKTKDLPHPQHGSNCDLVMLQLGQQGVKDATESLWVAAKSDVEALFLGHTA